MKFGFFQHLSRQWNGLERKLLPSYVWDSDPLMFWRERILLIICFIAGAVGPIALIPSVWLAYYEKLWGVLLLDITAYAVVVAVLFGRRLPFVIRAGVACTIFYALGIGILFALGPIGAGYIWLFGASVLVSAIIGFRAAVWTLVLNCSTLFAVGIFVAYGHPAWTLHLENALEKWIVMTVNFLLLNTLVIITTALMLDGLKTALLKEHEISANLKESENKYRLLADNTIDCIWLMDMQTVFTYVNPAIETILGYTPEEWIGTKLSKHCDEQHLEKMMGEIQRVTSALPEISGTTFEMIMYNRHGQPVDLEITGKIVFDHQGGPVGLQGVARNITERKQFEARLQQAQKHEAIGTLAGGIAHDFNNILASILGYTELVLDDLEKNTLIASNLQEVFTAGQRAKELVKQILTFARQTQGEMKPVQVGMIAKEVLKLLRSTIPATIELHSNLSSTSLVMADPTQIHQLFMNLCTNAAQAMENEGGKLTVSLEDVFFDTNSMKWKDEIGFGRYLKLSISDTGPGIAPDVIDNIFDPYFTTKPPGEGRAVREKLDRCISVKTVLQ